LFTGKKTGDDANDGESEEVKRVRKEVAAKRAKFPGLCIPDNPEETEVSLWHSPSVHPFVFLI